MHFFSTNKPSLMNVKIFQPIQFLGEGRISLKGVRFGVLSSPFFLSQTTYIEARNRSSKVFIDEGTFVNNGATIIADKGSVVIGKRCLIGTNFTVYDSDFHGIKVEDRFSSDYETIDVRIGDDVFIGSGVTILKGVTIGDGAIIAANSVLVKNVSALEIWGGNPAKFLKRI